MPLTLEEFRCRLVASGLLSDDDSRSLLASIPPLELPADGDSFAALLVQSSKLTSFQAQRLCAGRGETLTLGKYAILDELGQGGMGTVYKAEHRRMKRRVALKVLRPELLASPEVVKRFRREVEAVARLDHPNIVSAFDAGEDEGTSFLVMQFVDGQDLSSVVRERGPLPVEQAVDYVLQAARGLVYAHEQGIIHRDIKPSNLLVDRAGVVKVLDLGLATLLAKEAGAEESLTNSHVIVGTPDYMAPEQARGLKLADARSDIYSLGVTLWFLLTGKVAYEADGVMGKLLAHRSRPIPSLVAARPELPPPLDAIFQRMVAKQPAGRHQSMRAVVADLETLQASGHRAHQPATPASASRSGWQRAKGSALLLALASLLAAFGVWRSSSWRMPPENSPTESERSERPVAENTPLPTVAGLVSQQMERPLTVSKSADPQRRALETVFRLGGSASLSYQSGKGGDSVSRPEDLLDEPFWAWEVTIKNQKDVDAAAVGALKGLAFLRHLYLSNTGITDESVREIVDSHSLASLSVDGTKITDEGVRYLSASRDLRSLDVSSTGITDAACREMSKHPSLRAFSLKNTAITDLGLKELAALRTLHALDLNRNTAITKDGLAHLQSLPNLQILDLSGCSIGDEVTDVAARFSGLRLIDVTGTKMSSQAASRLQAALPGATIMHPALPQLEFDAGVVDWVKGQRGTVGKWTSDVPIAPFAISAVSFAGASPTNGAKNLLGLRSIKSLTWPNLKGADSEAESIGKLDSLTMLELAKSDLSDQGLRQLMTLSQLGYLYLTASTITDAGMSQIAAFQNLHSLTLDGLSCGEEGLAAIGNLSNLRQLALNNFPNVTSQGLRHIAELPNLTILDLRGTPIDDTGVVHLKRMHSLRLLLLQRTKITAAGIDEVKSGLPKCLILWDGGGAIPGATTEQKSADSIRSADPHYRVAQMVLKHGGSVFLHLAQRDEPHNASVSRSEDLPKVPFAVDTVNLANRKDVNDDDVRAMKGLSSIRELYLSFTNVGDESLQQLPTSRRLRILDLRGTRVTDELARTLASSRDLRYLCLASTRLTDAGCRHLRRLTFLQELDVSMTAITDAGLAELSGHPELNSFSTRANPRISEDGVAHLQSCPLLKKLDLSGTGVGDKIVEVLARFPRLRMVDVTSTRMTDEGAQRLRDALPSAIVVHPAIPPRDAEINAVRWVFGRKGSVTTWRGETLKDAPSSSFAVAAIAFPQEGGPAIGAENLEALSSIARISWWNLKDTDGAIDSMARLDSLETLELRQSDVSDAGLHRLASLRNLNWLTLEGPSRITNAGLANLTAFERLEVLSLAETLIGDEGLEPVGTRSTLVYLTLVTCPNLTSDGLRHLTKLSNLSTLDLRRTPVDDAAVVHLKQMVGLRVLRLESTKITPAGVGELHRALPECTILWDGGVVVPGTNVGRASGTSVPAAVPQSQELPTATAFNDPQRPAVEMILRHGGSVYVYTTQNAPEEAPISRIEDLPKAPFAAHCVNLANRKHIDDDDVRVMKELSSMRGLYLDYSDVGDESLQQLPVDRLQELALQGTRVTDGVADMLASSHDLRYLNLSKTRVGDATCRELSKHSYLRNLVLSDTSITDDGLTALAGHPTLRELYLSRDMGITKEGVAHLRTLPCLQVLDLSGTALGDEAIDVLARFAQLRNLDVTGTQMTSKGARRLQTALPAALVMHPELPQIDADVRAVQWVESQKGTASKWTTDVKNAPFAISAVTFPANGGPTTGMENLVGLRSIQIIGWPNLQNADVEVESIARLDSLVRLQLPRSDLSDAGLRRLASQSNVNQLTIGSKRITNEGLVNLTAFEHLENLSLVATLIGDEGLGPVGTRSTLVHLTLVSCPNVTSAGLKHLTKLSNLSTLDLRYTPVDDTAIVHLKQMVGLRVLRLERTKFTVAGIGDLHKALPECTILWDGGVVVPGTNVGPGSGTQE